MHVLTLQLHTSRSWSVQVLDKSLSSGLLRASTEILHEAVSTNSNISKE